MGGYSGAQQFSSKLHGPYDQPSGELVATVQNFTALADRLVTAELFQ